MRLLLLIAAFGALVWTGCGGGGGGNGGGGGSVPGGGSNSLGDTTHGTANCPPGDAILTATPIALGSILAWEPLGATNPTGHTFPTDHQYLYVSNPNAPINVTLTVVAPANMTIFTLYHYSGGGENPGYTVWFQPCAQIIGRFNGLTTLSSDLAAAAGPVNQNCTNFGYTQCQAYLQYQVQAGQPIGTFSTANLNYSMDFYLWDTRSTVHFTNPARWTDDGPEPNFNEPNIVPASAYYPPAMESQIQAIIGGVNGLSTAASALAGGTIGVDIDGTGMGHWFNPTNLVEAYGLALVPDDVHPETTEVISEGGSQFNVSNGGALGFRGSFSPVTTGSVNRAFESLTPDGNTYCYQVLALNTAGATRVVLLQLLNATNLKLEQLSASLSSCAAAMPWTFDSNAVSYTR